MKESVKFRLGLVLIVIALSVFFYFNNGVKLGLDLKGGVHLVLLMNTDISVYNRVQTDIHTAEAALKDDNVPFDKIYSSNKEKDAFIIEGHDPNLGMSVRDISNSQLNNYSFSALGEGRYKLTLKSAFEKKLRDQAIVQSVAVIRNRIDKYGVSAPSIHRQGLGSNKIVVELPGVQDSTEIKALIGKAAQLEWHLAVGPKRGAPSREALIKALGGKIPADVSIYPASRAKFGGQVYFALKSVAPITGADLQDVHVGGNQFGQPVVNFQLSATAGERFRLLTRTHLHQILAIVLDGDVISAPTINQEIGDSGQISGGFSAQEAKELVFQLKSGALPAIPHFAEERTIGPSLGLESIHRGYVSGLLGLLAIFIFMFFYYGTSGINANVCLLLNLVILMGIMTLFGLTLTVPGIAGIILTLGMAIDANVLIFERIKEELLENKTVQTAIANGFGKAFITIFDSNVTTLVAALFLLQFGTGPVRGFAVTLTVGLLVSMFTAIVVSRLIYDIVLKIRGRHNKRVTTLSIGSLKLFQNLHIPFMRYKYFLLSISAALILIGVGSLATRGINWGIDFRGGEEMQVRYSHPVNPMIIEKMLRKKVKGAITVIRLGKKEANEILIRMDAKDRNGKLMNEDQLSNKNRLILTTLRTPAMQSALAAGKIDVNTANTKAIADVILTGMHKGIISGTDAAGKSLADAIERFRKMHNGLLPSMAALKQISGMTNLMYKYLQKKVVVGALAVESIDTVGPTVGKELQDKAIQAVIGSLIGILLYAWLRFQFRFSVGAVVALIHDSLIAIGFLSLFHIEVNLPAVAALLTLLGYSINDTIVVYDRIRELMKTTRSTEDAALINRAVNETLSRTVITSALTFFVVFAMLIFGGKVLFAFSFVMTIGIIVGTYSSIFIASPFVLLWNYMGLQKAFSRKKKRYAK